MLLLVANWKTHDAVARSSNAHSRSSKALTKLNAASSSSKAASFSRNWSTSRISDPDFSVSSLQEKLHLVTAIITIQHHIKRDLKHCLTLTLEELVST